MRKILCLLLCLLLCACGDTSDIGAKIDNIFETDEVYNIKQNNYTKYINYYLPSDVYEQDSSLLTYTYTYNNSKLIMNVNVAGIINKKYYSSISLKDDGFFDDKVKVYSRSGEYKDNDNNGVYYFINVYEYDTRYLIHFMTTDLNMYGYCDIGDLVNLTSRILLMAKAAEINKDEVILTYSSKDVIDYKKTQVNLFENTFPVEGRVDELMIESGLQVTLN